MTDEAVDLHHRAEHCRRLAGGIYDERASHILLTMADEFDAKAGEIASKQHSGGGASRR